MKQYKLKDGQVSFRIFEDLRFNSWSPDSHTKNNSDIKAKVYFRNVFLTATRCLMNTFLPLKMFFYQLQISGGEEFLYNYDSHPQAVQNQSVPGTSGPGVEPKIDPKFQQLQNPQPQPTSLPGGFQLPPGQQLPPDIANILTHIQNTPSNPNDPVMSQVQHILNNLMVSFRALSNDAFITCTF